jgi:acyl-CoA synthetase (AMP-forming)/AMP-acid ligase II
MTIGRLPVRCARRYPDKKATVYREESQTFLEFNNRVNSLVSSLDGLGVKKDGKVGVLGRNRPEVLEIMFAAAKAGVVYVPLNFRLVPSELMFVINDAELDCLFVGDDFYPKIAEIKEKISVRNIFKVEDEYNNMTSLASTEEPPDISKPDDLFAIFYTSGTTGGPKGVMLTHENFLSGAINNTIAYKLGPHDVCLHVMPFYHTMEASIAVCQFYVGGTNVIADAFDGDEFWKLVEKEGVTHITLVYTMLMDILKAYKTGKYSMSSFRNFSVGGQTTPVPVIQDTLKTFGDNSIFVVYGLTEVSPLITYLPKEDFVLKGDKSRLLASVGKEMFTCHVRVVDSNDNDVSPGQLGEIIARGPNVMQGYWKRPEETNETLRGGWLRTGDMGTVDSEGYIYIQDRKKDLIISGGENISPHEIEDVLHKHPSLSDCAVIGIPDERWGEQVKAVVVLKEDNDATEEEIIKYCKENLAGYKCPRSVAFVDSLPKDPVGKVQKRILQEQYSKRI